MLTDGLTQKQSEGEGDGVEIQDVSQMLLAAVKRGDATTDGGVDRRREGAGAPPTASTTPTSGTQADGARRPVRGDGRRGGRCLGWRRRVHGRGRTEGCAT